MQKEKERKGKKKKEKKLTGLMWKMVFESMRSAGTIGLITYLRAGWVVGRGGEVRVGAHCDVVACGAKACGRGKEYGGRSSAKGWCCSGQYRRVVWVGSWVVGSGGSLFNACTSNAHTVLDCAIVHQPVSLYGSSLNSLANTSFVTHPTLPLHLLSPLPLTFHLSPFNFHLSPFTSQLSSVPFHLSSPRIHTVPFSVATSHV